MVRYFVVVHEVCSNANVKISYERCKGITLG
jgi:hypothetical protein